MSDDCSEYQFAFKEDPDRWVTITALLISDMSVRYRTPRKTWDEHEALLSATKSIDQDQLRQVEQYLKRDGFMNLPYVWCLTPADLERLDLSRIELKDL